MRKRRILIIDDEPEITSMIKLGLEASGKYIVVEENNSRKAMNTAHVCDPDLIILDVMMPDKTGTEIAADLREDARLASVPILFLTVVAPQEDAGDSHQTAQHRHYMPKPFHLNQLMDRIDSFLPK